MSKLTIKNFEKIKKSNTLTIRDIDVQPNEYIMDCDWAGFLWNVYIDRNSTVGGWNIEVHREGGNPNLKAKVVSSITTVSNPLFLSREIYRLMQKIYNK